MLPLGGLRKGQSIVEYSDKFFFNDTNQMPQKSQVNLEILNLVSFNLDLYLEIDF